jgi:hypothetical protein
MRSTDVFTHITQAIKKGDYSLSGDQLIVACPVCDKSQHLYVFIPKGLFHCFKCDFSGTVRSEILANPSRWRPVSQLRGTHGEPQEGISRATADIDPHIQGGQPATGSPGLVCLQNEPASQVMRAQFQSAYRYCRDRGLTNKQIEEYRVSVTQGEGRVFFPYWDQAGTTTYWMGRAYCDETTPKTIESTGSDKPLFGRHVQKLVQFVVLVEGVFDHFVTPQSYALMGSTISPGQVMQLRGDGAKWVFVLLDADARQRQSLRVAERLLRAGLKPFPVILQNTKKDPADLGRKVMRGLVNRLTEVVPGRPRTLRLFVPSDEPTRRRSEPDAKRC